MAQHELLVKLGLQSESFTRNIRNVNNQLKLTEVEFKKLETSTKNFGNSQKDLEAKLKSLKTTKEQLTAKTLLYKNKIEELNTKIKDAETKHEGLAKKLENEKSKLSELETTQGKNSKAYKEQSKVVKDLQQEYDKSKKNIENFNLSLQKNEIDLLNTEIALNKVKNTISQLSFEKATFGLNQLSNKLDSLSKKMNNVSQKLGSAGSAITASITTPIALAGSSIVKFGSEFSTSMSEVKALSGATGEDFKKLESKAREMGKATSFTAKEAADGLGYMALAGWNTREMLTSIEPVLRLAEAGNIDLATTSDLVTDSMSTLGITAGDLGGYLDIVATASANSNTKVEQMLRTYNQVGGTFKRFNVPLEESGALIGVLANRGLKAEQAGRSLSSILINLTGGSTTAAKALDALGVSAYDSEGNFRSIEAVLKDLHTELNKVENGTAKYTEEQKNSYLAMIGGKTQIRTLDALLNGVAETTANGTTEFQELKEELLNSEGALAKMAETMKDNLQGDWEKFTSMVGELKLKIFDLVEGPLRQFVQGLTNLTEKFVNLDSDSQKFIIKATLIAASIGPVLLAVAGLTKGLSLMTGGLSLVIGGFVNFGKTISDIAGGVRSGMSLFSAMSATIAGLPAILAIAAAAFVAITATIGDNEFMLASLQEKWGTFGTVVGGVCEFISGSVKMSLGNLLIAIGGLGKAIVAFVSGKWREIDDIMRETGASMQTNTKEAWSNIKMESTRAISDIRNMTERDMGGVKTAFEGALKTLPSLTRDNLNKTGEEFANLFKSANGNMLDLSDSTIKILRGTSDTMATLFSGIKGNMDLEEAKVQFVYNMEALLRSGEINLDKLQLEFQNAGKLIADNMANSFERTKNETGKILNELGDIARDGLGPVADDITSIVDGMSGETIKTIRNMGTNWSTLLKGIGTDGSMSIKEMKRVILQNMEELGLNTPEKLQAFKTALTQELEKAKENAGMESKEIGNKVTEGLEEGAQEGVESAKEGVKNAAKEVAEGAEEGMTEGLVDLPQSVHDELAKAGVEINSQGQVIVEDMSKKGGEAGKAYVDTLNQEMPQLSNTAKLIQDQLAGIDSVRLGGVTKQLSEVNRWLITVQNTSLKARQNLNNLTNLPFGNTTKGLSEVNKWLSSVANSAKTTRSALINLTNLPFGNTTKGLSEVNKWLGTVAKSAATTANALKEITKVTYGSVTKGLSEINKWLGSVKTSASSAATYLKSIANVKFGGVTKGLSEVNKWLGTVANKASTARTAISSVSTVRTRAISLNQDAEKQLARTNLNQPEPTLYKYRTSYDEDFISRILPNAKNSSREVKDTTGNSNDSLTAAIFALIDAISNTDISAYVNVDGKQIARATAPFIKNEIDKINLRKNRLAGI